LRIAAPAILEIDIGQLLPGAVGHDISRADIIDSPSGGKRRIAI
jgi:hypothetical protein